MEMKIFENTEFGSVRTINIDGEFYFVGKDVAVALGYADTRKAISTHVDEDDGAIRPLTDNIGRKQETTLINESGLYSLVLSSKLPNAKKFKHWITAEVLPSIRKTGAYMTEQAKEKQYDEMQMLEAKAKADRAYAMKMNAENRRLKILMSNPAWKDISDVALQAMGIRTVEDATGENLGHLLPKCDKTYSATEVGEILGITANRVGITANDYGLKTEGWGEWVMDKSRYSSHQCSVFRYNEVGIRKIAEILGIEGYVIK